jgi:hypothetical protein
LSVIVKIFYFFTTNRTFGSYTNRTKGTPYLRYAHERDMGFSFKSTRDFMNNDYIMKKNVRDIEVTVTWRILLTS